MLDSCSALFLSLEFLCNSSECSSPESPLFVSHRTSLLGFPTKAGSPGTMGTWAQVRWNQLSLLAGSYPDDRITADWCCLAFIPMEIFTT